MTTDYDALLSGTGYDLERIDPMPIYGLTDEQSLEVRVADSQVPFDFTYSDSNPEETHYILQRNAKISEYRETNGF